MTAVSRPPQVEVPFHAPVIEAHRLIGDGHSAALVLPDATIDWWCAPAFDSPPLLWWLLDAAGGVARWTGARMVSRDDRPAGPTSRTRVSVAGRHVDCWDGIVTGSDGHATCLVRLVRAVDRPCTLHHEVAAGGFDSAALDWSHAALAHDGSRVVLTGGRSVIDGRWLRTEVDATADGWRGFVIAVGGDGLVDAAAMADALGAAEAAVAETVDACRLPRHHPERVRDALLVLDTCTYRPTAAVIASPTTSLPEVVGGTAQWDYRYTWLRDASLAVSVAALLGRRDVADRYLRFVLDMTKDRRVPSGPFTDVRMDGSPSAPPTSRPWTRTVGDPRMPTAAASSTVATSCARTCTSTAAITPASDRRRRVRSTLGHPGTDSRSTTTASLTWGSPWTPGPQSRALLRVSCPRRAKGR